MRKVKSTIGEVRVAPNLNQYCLVSVDGIKHRAALLLIEQKNPQSFHSEVITIALAVWLEWKLEAGKNESEKITDRVRLTAYRLLMG